MPDPVESRSPLSVGIAWAYRCLAVGLAFTLPTLAGRAGDDRWGTGPGLTIAGAVAGFILGFIYLLRMVGRPGRPARRP